MKPILLEFSGLQSYREPQSIDFRELLGGGLFGIFGPTGSGKSTILDAITLALYGRVTRAKGTAGIMNTAEKRLWVKFSFVLQGGGQYRVERSYKRDRTTESIRTEHCRLVQVNDQVETVLADKDGDLNEKIVAILGLTLDDFARAVVLPQGQFAEFLQLTNTKRRDMLQRIFNLTQYGDKLAERLKHRLGVVQTQLARVESEQIGLGDASVEAVASAQAHWAGIREQVMAAEAALRTFEAEYSAMSQVWELQQESLQVMAARRLWEGRMSEAIGWRSEADASLRAEQVRPRLEAHRQARVLADAAQSRFHASRAVVDEATVAALEAATQHEAARQYRRQEEPLLTEQRLQLQRAVNLEERLTVQRARTSQLTQQVAADARSKEESDRQAQAAESAVSANRSQEETVRRQMSAVAVDTGHRVFVQQVRRALDRCEAAQKAQSESQQRLSLRQEAHAQAQQQAERARAEMDHAHGLLGRLDQALTLLQQERPCDEAELRTQDEWLSKADEQVRSISQMAEVLLRCEAEEQRCAAEVIRLDDVAVRAAAAESEALARVSQVREGHAQAREALAESRRQEHAIALVAALVAGEPCPVCGSSHHPNPAAPEAGFDAAAARDAVQWAEQALAQTQAEHLTAVSLRAKAEGEAAHGRTRHTEARESTRQAASQLQTARFRLPQSWQPLEPEALPTALSSEQAQQSDRRQRYQSWQQQLDEQRGRREELVTALATAKVDLSAAEATLRSATLSLSEATTEWEQRSQDAMAQQTAFDAVGGGYQASTLAAEEERIATADREAASLQEALHMLLSERQRLDATVTEARRRQEESTRHLHLLQVDLAQAEQSLADAAAEWSSLTGGKPAPAQLQRVEAALRELEEAESRAATARERAEAARREAEAEWAGAQREHEIGSQRLTEAAQGLKDSLAAAAFDTLESAETALRPPERRAQLEQWIAEYDREGDRLQSRQGQLADRLAGRSLSASQWQEWQERRERVQHDLSEQRDLLGRATQALDERLKRQQRWQELEGQRTRHTTSLNHLEDLRGLLRGNAFVDFLAQEQMTRVATEASARLSQLTRDRYALEAEPGGGFIIRDDGNGGTRRSVTTLSGGETFLTSLALSLALSAQIQLRGHYPLEFFFLDEGFGTLDPELLDVVITTLERLHFEQLHVGVISHVPELRNRLARRVIVESAEPGGRGSRVRLERA